MTYTSLPSERRQHYVKLLTEQFGLESHGASFYSAEKRNSLEIQDTTIVDSGACVETLLV